MTHSRIIRILMELHGIRKMRKVLRRFENIILLMEVQAHLGDIKRECFAIIVIIGRDLLPVPRNAGIVVRDGWKLEEITCGNLRTQQFDRR